MAACYTIELTYICGSLIVISGANREGKLRDKTGKLKKVYNPCRTCEAINPQWYRVVGYDLNLHLRGDICLPVGQIMNCG